LPLQHTTSFAKGQSIAITLAIGLQDIPEGMAASLVLVKLGMSKQRSFFWGQMTGIAEIPAGVLGALAVSLVRALLPFALGYAGGTMLFIILKGGLRFAYTLATYLSPFLVMVM
jgi:ZIP family zinc transporter